MLDAMAIFRIFFFLYNSLLFRLHCAHPVSSRRRRFLLLPVQKLRKWAWHLWTTCSFSSIFKLVCEVKRERWLSARAIPSTSYPAAAIHPPQSTYTRMYFDFLFLPPPRRAPSRRSPFPSAKIDPVGHNRTNKTMVTYNILYFFSWKKIG